MLGVDIREHRELFLFGGREIYYRLWVAENSGIGRSSIEGGGHRTEIYYSIIVLWKEEDIVQRSTTLLSYIFYRRGRIFSHKRAGEVQVRIAA